MTRPKRIAAWAGLVLLIFVGLLEGTARLMTVGSGDVGAIIPDPDLGWRLASDHAGEMAEVQITSDSRGVRVAGPEVAANATAQAGQVVWLMGDSFTFGWGVEWADTVAARQRLSETVTLRPRHLTRRSDGLAEGRGAVYSTP